MDKNVSDGNAGVERSVTGAAGKTRSYSSKTQVEGDVVKKEQTFTGRDGKTATRKKTADSDSVEVEKTGRLGKKSTRTREK